MLRTCLLTLLLLSPLPAIAQMDEMTLGGDLYVAGSGTSDGIAAGRDPFGRNRHRARHRRGDAHCAGFDVGVETKVMGDAYASGGAFGLRAPAGDDLTASGSW